MNVLKDTTASRVINALNALETAENVQTLILVLNASLDSALIKRLNVLMIVLLDQLKLMENVLNAKRITVRNVILKI